MKKIIKYVPVVGQAYGLVDTAGEMIIASTNQIST